MINNNFTDSVKNVTTTHTRNEEIKIPVEADTKTKLVENSSIYLNEIYNLLLFQSKLIIQQQNLIDILSAKPARFEKTESEEKDLKKLVKYKNPIKILLLISVTLMVIAGIIVVVLQYTHKPEDIYNPTEPGDGSDNLGSHQVLDRTVWNGRPPKRVLNITSPVPMVIIKHTGGRTCDSLRVCAGIIQTIQSQCVTNGESDIYYNFLIGGDGNIYVGRGWDAQPAQRNDTIDIAFLGSYAFDTLTPTMIEAARMLIDDGHKKEKLTDDYIIVCHNQTMATESPGANVCAEVRTWPHYDPGTYFAPKLTTPSTTRVL